MRLTIDGINREVRCHTCQFWDGDRDRPNWLGQCHRHAPVAAPELIGRSAIPLAEGILPKTLGTFACGDFIPETGR